MRVLLTGASSFTGFWFASSLRAGGFDVIAPLRRKPASYEGVRGERVQKLAAVANIVPDCSFGSGRFLDLVARERFDLLCHHAARVTDYRSMSFDIVGALAENTNNVEPILERMAASGLKAVVLTGTVFEANEGAGSWPLRAFSPYGVSKGLTSDVFRYWCTHFGIPFAKFVIPNPFGPFEEPRFCAYLMQTWRASETAEVRTPLYLRDNIHVDVLALAYADYVKRAGQGGHPDKFGPMGYVETQAAFMKRFAREMRSRLDWECAVRIPKQTDFSEPIARINTHPLDTAALGWSESAAWDAIAEYYRERL
ncbi:MAG TPA: NAD(P)-dependent oxidoreductase [Xanthobacteraceae bacterium]|jgi:nucleoside-diphosphate-sugar epimerase